MVRHTLKILQQMLQDFESVSDHFGTLCIEELKISKVHRGIKEANTKQTWCQVNFCKTILADYLYVVKRHRLAALKYRVNKIKCYCVNTSRFDFNVTARKLQIKEILFAVFFNKIPALQLVFCVPDVTHLYDLQMSIILNFSVQRIKSKLEIKERVESSCFFMASNIWNIEIWTKYARLERIFL